MFWPFLVQFKRSFDPRAPEKKFEMLVHLEIVLQGRGEWSLGLPMFIILNAPPSPPLACLTEQDTPTRATFTSVQTSSSMFSEIEVFRVF